MPAKAEPTTWFGVITAPGRRLLTTGMGLLIVAATVLSIQFPAASSWLTIGTGLIGAAWYTRMMTIYKRARHR